MKMSYLSQAPVAKEGLISVLLFLPVFFLLDSWLLEDKTPFKHISQASSSHSVWSLECTE